MNNCSLRIRHKKLNNAVSDTEKLISDLQQKFPFLTPFWARRLIRAYGAEATDVLGDVQDTVQLGRDFGATLTEAEVRWLMEREYAQTAEDVVWRRSKLGLRLTAEQVAALDQWMSDVRGVGAAQAAQ